MEIFLTNEDDFFGRQDMTLEHEEEEIWPKEKHKNMVLQVKVKKIQVGPDSSRRQGLECYKKETSHIILIIIFTISSLQDLAHGSLPVHVIE